MAFSYPSYAAPTPYPSTPDIAGDFFRSLQAGQNVHNEGQAQQSLSALGQSLEQPADTGTPNAPPPLSQFGLPAREVLLPMLQNPQTRDQAIALIRTATDARTQATDPLRKLQLEKAQYEMAHQGDGPVDTISRDAGTRFKLGRDQGLTGDALKQFTLTGKLPDAGGGSLINAGNGQLYDPNTKQWIAPPDSGPSAAAGSLPTVQVGQNGDPDPGQQTAFFDQLGAADPAKAALLKQVLDYRAPIEKVTSMRGGDREAFAALAAQADPTFDMSQYTARAKARVAYTTGQQGQTITSANTVIGHLSNLAEDADRLGNGDSQLGNVVKNAIGGAFSNKDLATFNSDKMAVASELAKFFKGTGATDLTTTQEWQSVFDQNTGPGALKAVVSNVIGNLMKSRLDEMRSQFSSAMGKPSDFRFITPETDAVLKKMGIDTSAIDPTFGNGSGGGTPDAGIDDLLKKYGQ